MPLSAQEICELISKRNGDSIRKIEETAGLGKDSLRTAISRGASLSSKSEEKILEAYSFLNPTYIKIGEGEPYIGNTPSGTFVPKKPSFEARYLTLLEEIAEERKQRNASIMDRLDRIEANQNKMLELITTNSSNMEAYRKSVEWNLRVTVKALAQIIPPDWKPGSAQSKQKLSKLVNAIQEDMIREDSEKGGN